MYTVNPTLFLNLRYGLNRRKVVRTPFSTGFDFTQLGFPAVIKPVAQLQALEFPRFDVNSFSSLGQETFNDLVIAPTTHSFDTNVTKILARHTFKFGTDIRREALDVLNPPNPTGSFTINTTGTNSLTATGGNAVASLLLGQVNAFTIDIQRQLLQERAHIAELAA